MSGKPSGIRKHTWLAHGFHTDFDSWHVKGLLENKENK
jgi:hypothetical protein